jgi:predicted TIM-barrel fold metal-dependent hydrolase
VFRTLWRSIVVVALSSRIAPAQAPVDSGLAHYISGIRAIDNHAHPMRPVPNGAPADTEFDALPLDGIPAFDVPNRLKPDDQIWRAAQSALYRISPTQTGAAYHTTLKAAVTNAQRDHGQNFPTWALDQAGIDIMMSNRVVMGPGLTAPRFRWISFVDPLMLPLDTRAEAVRTPDTKSLYPREAKLLKRYLSDLKIASLPATLDEYVRTVVNATLGRERANGAVGVKFEAAYLRPLDFDEPDVAAAQRTYAKYVRSGTPTRAEYKNLQDYLFRAIALEAGRQKLAIQIHVLETFGGFYSPRGSAPHLLESVFNDSTLRGTKFIIVHGGWPHVGETQGLMSKPNVYADISMIDDILSPTVLAGVLRQWLGEWPDKVLFGSDAFDGGAEQGWEQVAWVGSTTARRALAIALTGMLRDGEINRDRAQALARMVLRENAATLYGLKAEAPKP